MIPIQDRIERIAKVDALLLEGVHTYGAIRAMTGASRQTIRNRAARLGVPPAFLHRPSKIDLETVNSMLKKGLTQVQIAKELGVSQSAISLLLKRKGVQSG